MYRKAVAMLCVKDNTFLLIHRSGTGKDGWGFPKGGIEKGESPKEALLREMNEELGLIPKDFLHLKETEFILKYDWNAYLHQQTGFQGQENIMFLAELREGHSELDVFGAGELDDYCWATEAEVLRMLPHDNQKDIFITMKKMMSSILTNTPQ